MYALQRLRVVVIALAFVAVPAQANDFSARLADHKEAQSEQAKALFAQALAHEHGESAPKDLAQAAALYCEAAWLGEVEAMYALGWMYANGRGLERDDRHAAALFARAAREGHEHAAKMLRFTGDEEVLPECLVRPASIFAGRVKALEDRIGRLSAERQQVARMVVELAPSYQVSPAFALAIALTESALDPTAISPKNAMGVMQLIPDTASRFNVRNAFDPKDNIQGGLAYLRWLLAYFEGNLALASAAYNAGEGAVERYRGVPPFRETRAYVERIMLLVDRDTHPYDSSIASPSRIMQEIRVANQEAGS